MIFAEEDLKEEKEEIWIKKDDWKTKIMIENVLLKETQVVKIKFKVTLYNVHFCLLLEIEHRNYFE